MEMEGTRAQIRYAQRENDDRLEIQALFRPDSTGYAEANDVMADWAKMIRQWNEKVAQMEREMEAMDEEMDEILNQLEAIREQEVADDS